MTEIKSLDQIAEPATEAEVSAPTPPVPSAPATPGNSFATLKKELNAPLKNFLARTEGLLEQAKVLDLQMFKLDLQEIQGSAQQLLSLLENPPKRQIPKPQPEPAPVVMPKPVAQARAAV